MKMIDLKSLACLFRTIVLPPIQLDKPWRIGLKDCQPVPEALQRYWAHYGFDDIQQRHSVSYYMGQQESARGHVATHYWRPKVPRATVVVVHGLFDHVGLYLKLVDDLLARGYAVLAFDLPGHGLSEGVPTEIDDFAEYADCLAQSVKLLLSIDSKPVYALGQSTGGAVIAHYILNRTDEARAVSRVALLAPLLYPRSWHLVHIAYRLFGWFLQRVKRTFSDASHDKRFSEFLRYRDPLQARYLSIRWIASMIRWTQQFRALPTSTVPLLIVQGSHDMTVDGQRNVPLYQSKFLRVKTRLIDGAGHQLVNELPHFRDDIFAEIASFFDADHSGVEIP